MPTGKIKNLCYQVALPWMAPSVKGKLAHVTVGRPLYNLKSYENLLTRHHVLGSSLLLTAGETQSVVYSSTLAEPIHTATADTLFRVASITKIATAVVVLRLVDEEAFSLDTPVSALLPDADDPTLFGITIRHLLCHTSGLRDVPVVDEALMKGQSFHEVLGHSEIRLAPPGASFAYCNFGFGLLGCVIEYVIGKPVDQAFEELLFAPLGMRATLNGSTLEEGDLMPIERVLRYRPGHPVTITPLGRKSLGEANPECHFGHTAGAMYTDAASLSKLLGLISHRGETENGSLISPRLMKEMISKQSSYGQISPTLHYGLGLLLIEDRSISNHRIIGHQGFAYGCADGAFYEEGTGRQVIFLNGGCSEARTGRLGLCNRDLLRWALRKELPAWK